MTDVYVIPGFLEAGETTLIRTMVHPAFKNKKLVVVENDFGEAGVDAGLLKECNLAVTSLGDGCTCCSLIGDFKKAVERILKDYIPDVVSVEPSGVVRLSDLIKICLKQEDRGLIRLKRAIAMVDIRSFDKYKKNYGGFFEDRITYADLILLSHQEERGQEVRSVKIKIQEMNPEARVEADPWESIPASIFRYGPRNSNIFKLEMEATVSMKPVRIRSCREPSRRTGFIRRHFARDVFSSVTIRWKELITEKWLGRKVLCVVKHAEGEILRGKGIVADGCRGLVFHYLPGSLNTEPADVIGNQVCLIGTGLNEQQIHTLLREETT